MRMYLSSFDLGACPERLVSLVGEGRRAAIVVNALDHRPEARASWLESQSRKLAALGFHVTELDLRQYFDAPQELNAELAKLDLVWVNGGNAFLLRRAMKQSGFDVRIVELLKRDAIVYAGFSAAVVITSTNLRALDQVSNPREIADGYVPAVVWEGLGLLPYSIVVHFESDHPESAAVNAEVEFYERHGVPYRTLRDGEALVIDGEGCGIAGGTDG
ncbi:serine peptidase [Bordetella genomosp. 9]|uniref:Serine peptidase n=1 Tax=Bordetella genomosp. 9 TaxID=1416803 RepID=A0A261RFN9_9BORD|nr:Type 1 glutamine amidotransferase-like domain-containing protein [Bordetella genomosp. 9]OZI23846.1 serine peptidase [Bordetella genomosp. 9]